MTGEGKNSGADPRQYYIAAGTEDAKLVRFLLWDHVLIMRAC